MKKIRAFTAADDVVTVGVVHDLNLAARFADHIVLLNEGRIIAEGTPAEVLTTELIHAVFGVKPIFVPTDDSNFYIIFD